VRLYIRNSEQQEHAFKIKAPREGELRASDHTSSALDSIAGSNLGRSKRFPPPTQNLNIQRRLHGRNTRGLLVRHRPSLIDEIATPQGQIYSYSEQKFVEMPKTDAV
jgi:hypothetical protein